MKENNKIKDAVLRYLGYKGQEIDSITDNSIDLIIEEARGLIQERYTYKIFNIDHANDRMLLSGSEFYLPGKDIESHLKLSKSCFLMAASLGNHIDTRIRYYEKLDMASALILDACCTAFIEDLCDEVCKKIEEEDLEKDQMLTKRYSPGYGDLPIDIQNEFLGILDAQRSIGLTASSSSILIPRKSVTAVMGVVRRKSLREEENCYNCHKFDSCDFSRGGKTCGY